MANRKISDLTALTAPAAGDYLPIVDISEAAAADKNKRITIEELFRGVPDGTAAAPSIATENDPNTGIYSSGADQLSIATNGTERLRIDSAGQIEAVSLGTAAAPTFSFTGDPNTGIYSPGADQLAISTGGTGRLFVDASGNIGVGATPLSGHQLTVNAASLARIALQTVSLGQTSSDGFALEMDSSGVYFTNRENIPSIFYTNNQERLRITSAGNVGIGTSAPSSALHVNGDVTVGSTSPTIVKANGDINFASNYNGILSKNSSYVYLGSTNNSVALWPNSGTNASPGLVIDNSNRVGIGTTSPGDRLELQGGTFRISANSLQYHTIAYSSNNFLFTANAGAANQNSNFVFSSSTAGSAVTERLRIDSSGRLLVGTSSATSYGSFSPHSIESTTFSNYTLSIKSNSTTANPLDSPNIIMSRSGGNAVGSMTTVASGNRLGDIFFAGADGANLQLAAAIEAFVDGTPGTGDMPGRLVFSTTADGAASPTERMRIDSTGLVTLAGPGIKFPATQVASADPNTLDDYEEGTFTPEFRDGPTGNAAPGYSQRTGKYTKIGNVVSYYIFLNDVTTTGLTAGNTVHLTGLPFASVNLTFRDVPSPVICTSATPTTGAVYFSVTYNQSYGILINGTTTGSAVFTVSQATSGTFDCIISGTYYVS